MRRIVPRANSSAATVSAKVVLPAPGVATAKKSRGSCARYCSTAAACQARSFRAVPHGARPGKAGGRCERAVGEAWVGPGAEPVVDSSKLNYRPSLDRSDRCLGARANPRKFLYTSGRPETYSGHDQEPRLCRIGQLPAPQTEPRT